jgi:uncharacterized heparinase superfamily protein
MVDAATMRRRQAAEAVLAYLARHPRVVDTEQGIAQWWLPAVGVDVPRSDLHDALEELVQNHQLERLVLPDGGVLYRAPTGQAAPPAGGE